ncbi:hypothetical protein B0H19DRAFT_1253008 [Mycena capillaripes]|nr:hypothetical protein B0H19DRAFT_1253008 [Mycena capillaripes]
MPATAAETQCNQHLGHVSFRKVDGEVEVDWLTWQYNKDPYTQIVCRSEVAVLHVSQRSKASSAGAKKRNGLTVDDPPTDRVHAGGGTGASCCSTIEGSMIPATSPLRDPPNACSEARRRFEEFGRLDSDPLPHSESSTRAIHDRDFDGIR